jgi:hypothetical protein
VAGIGGRSFFQCAPGASANSRRGIRTRDLSAVGFVEVTLSFTTPQFPNVVRDLLTHFFVSSSAHTRTVHPPTSFHSANNSPLKKFREESALTVLGFEPRALRPPYHRSIRELRHPGTLVPRRNCLERNDLGGYCFRFARTSSPRDPIALASFRLGFYLLVSFVCSSRSVRTRRQAGVQLRYPESKRTSFFCQDFFSKTFVFGPFFA